MVVRSLSSAGEYYPTAPARRQPRAIRSGGSIMRISFISLAAVAVLVAAYGSSSATGAAPATGAPTNAPKASAQTADSGMASSGPTNRPTGAGSSEPDACSLLTTGEATAALGEAVDAGVVPTSGERSCLWSTTKLSTNAVEISVTGMDTFNPDQKSISGLTITKVSGVGDAAHFVSMGGGYQNLAFRKVRLRCRCRSCSRAPRITRFWPWRRPLPWRHSAGSRFENKKRPAPLRAPAFSFPAIPLGSRRRKGLVDRGRPCPAATERSPAAGP